MTPPRTLEELEAAISLLFDIVSITEVVPVPGADAAIVVANPGETYQALLWSWPEGRLMPLTEGTEPVFQALPSPDGRRMAVLRDTGGDELYRIWLHDIAAGEGRLLTPNPLGRVTVVDWFPTGDALLVAGNDDVDNFIARFDIESAVLTKVFTSDRWLEGAALSPDGSMAAFAVCRGDDLQNYDIGIVPTAGGEPRWITTGEPVSRDIQPLFSPDGRRLAFSSELDDVPLCVFYDLQAGAEYARIPIPGETETLTAWDGDGVLLLIQRRGRQLVIRVSPEGPVSDFAETQGSVSYVRADGARLCWVQSRFTEAPTLKAFQLDGQELAGLNPSAHIPLEGAVSDLWLDSTGGTSVHCWLIEPSLRESPAPGLVYPHGGPTWAQLDAYRRDIQEYLLAGFTVIAPNFRGSTGYGPAFRKANLEDLGGGDFDDTMAAARWLARQPAIDPARIAITGGSYGGYMTLWAMVREPEAWAAGVAYVPVADWVDDYQLADATFRYFDVYFFGGTPEEQPDLYRDRSPITHVANLARPLLISHGRNDSRCPFPPVERFVEQALELGKSVEFEVQEDEGHGAAKKRTRIESDLRALRFLVKHLYP